MENDPNENLTPTPESTPVDQGASGTADNQPQGEEINQQKVEGTESPESGEQQTSPSDQLTENKDDEQSKDDDFEWDGNNVDDLPKPLQKRAKDMLRHMHKVSQEAAQVKKYAEAYNQIVNHPEFQEFLDWKEGKTSPQSQAPQNQQNQSNITEEDLLAAQGDPQKFSSLLQQHIQGAIQPYIQEFQKFTNNYQQERALEQGNRTLDTFAKEHPDFWDIDPAVMKGAIQDIVVRQQGTLEDAYKYAKNVEQKYMSKAKSSLQKEVEKKKKAMTASPSKTANPSVVYVNSVEEARKVAYENAALGKKVDVRIKRK